MAKKLNLNISSFLALFFFAALSQAQTQTNIQAYYGTDFMNLYQSHGLTETPLKARLFKIISSGHKPIGYESAKDVIFGHLFLKKTSAGYSVKDVYCERNFTDADFGGRKTFGPMMAPITGDVLNTEHTWPQSHFTSKFPKETQKADLHHLFPTDSKMNGTRSNFHFGNVLNPKPGLKCPIAKLGSSGKDYVFEVPMKQRGNSARAIFYFSIRYKIAIPKNEEIALRQWSMQDPIDQEESDHNTMIQQVQKNRNPFVDMPDLLQKISSFSDIAY